MKRFYDFRLGLLLVAFLFVSPASAQTTIDTDGGTISLELGAIQGNTMRGMLSFQLSEGWKTYWRDPGSSGIPPQIDSTNSEGVTSVQLHFPAPKWIDDPYGAWAGYTEPVDYPLTITLGDGVTGGVVSFDLFAGICAEVCIPVSGTVAQPFGNERSQTDRPNELAIDAAFRALPPETNASLGVDSVAYEGGRIMISLSGPDAASQDDTPSLFVVGEGDDGALISFKRPTRHTLVEGLVVYETTPVKASTSLEGTRLRVTAVSKKNAVERLFDLPSPVQ